MSDQAEHFETAAGSGESKADLSTVQSVDKALMIVELLMRRGESLSAREIALRTGINRTTGHRLLNALMHRGWIEKETNSAAYRVSLRFLVLSNLAYQQRDVLTASEDEEQLARGVPDVSSLQVARVYAEALVNAAEQAGQADEVLGEYEEMLRAAEAPRSELRRFFASGPSSLLLPAPVLRAFCHSLSGNHEKLPRAPASCDTRGNFRFL